MQSSNSPGSAVIRFLALAFGISWILGVVVAAVLQALLPDGMDRATLLVAKFGPSAAGVIMAHAVGGRDGLRFLVRAALRFRAPAAGYAAALLGPPAVWLLALALFERSGGTVDWSVVAGLRAQAVLPVLGTFTFLGGGLGEELGWRGFALPVLQRRLGAGAATLILGVAWAAWHYPALLLDRSGDAGPLWLFTAFVLAASVIMTWLYNSTGGNVLFAVLFHAAFNASETLVAGAVAPADERMLEMWLVGIYAAVALLLLAVYRTENLSARERTVWPELRKVHGGPEAPPAS